MLTLNNDLPAVFIPLKSNYMSSASCGRMRITEALLQDVNSSCRLQRLALETPQRAWVSTFSIISGPIQNHKEPSLRAITHFSPFTQLLMHNHSGNGEVLA